MKTKTLPTSQISTKALPILAGVALYALTVTSAFAAVTPSVSTTIRNTSNTEVSSAAIGSSVHANVLVSSSTGPTALGTVSFNYYPNMSCTGTPTVQSGVLLASGAANSMATTVGSNGLSYKVNYDGQTDVYLATLGNCVSLQPTSANVTLSTGVSSTSAAVGSYIYQTGQLNNITNNATGTIAFSRYTNSSCTADKVDMGTKTVSNWSLVQSNSIQFNTVGTYYLGAVYSGDQFNSAATSTCKTVTVTATSTPNPTPTPTPTPTPNPGTGSISGTLYNDLNRNLVRDGGEAGIANVQVKLHGGTFYFWNWNKRMSQTIKTVTTDSSGNYSFIGLSDGIYGVEEVVPSGWKQISSDFKWVLIINGKQLTGLDFANYVKASSTTGTTTPVYKNHGQEKKAENMAKKEERKEERKKEQEERKEAKKESQINKLLNKIEKIKNR